MKNSSNPSPFMFLTPEQVEHIHETSLDILKSVGVKVRNEKAREIFSRHGCSVDSKTLIVRLSRKVVEEYIALAPSRITLYGRDPKYDVTIPDDGPLFSTSGSAPNIVDLETGKVRFSTMKDIEQIVRMSDELPGIDFVGGGVVVPNDDTKSIFARVYPGLKYSLKTQSCSLGGYGVEELNKVLSIYAVVAGSEEAFYERPFVRFGNCAMISPLTMDNDSTELLICLSEKKLSTLINICPTGGLSAPLSLIGTLAQGNAEFLATACLMQMAGPGVPVIYGGVPVIAELRTGAYAVGGVETGMLVMGYAQMAKYYNVPSAGFPGQTNSKVVDAQAGFERALSATAAVLAGTDFLNFAGIVNGLMDFDYGMLMVDNEISLMLKRMKRGYEYSAEELRLSSDAIKEIGPGGNFISSMHTAERMRTVPYFPELADRLPRSDWEIKGSLDLNERALEKARKILSREHPGYITPDVKAKIMGLDC